MGDLIEELIRTLRAMWVHRWPAISAAWLCALVGWLAVYSLPDVYEANARFYIDASSRLREVVHELGMEADVSSRVFLVRQAMLSSPQLEKVARETDLAIRAESEEEYEDLILSILNNISLSTGRNREARNLFSISFRDNDRETSISVVRALLDGFVENILEQKDSDTARAEAFLQDQLSYYRELLRTTESELERFKRSNPGFANRERVGVFERLQREQELLDGLLSERDIEANKRNELLRQLSELDPGGTRLDDEDFYSSLPVSIEIEELERARQQALLRYTEEHPDVKVIEEQINQLKNLLKEGVEETPGTRGADESLSTNPIIVEIQIALSNTNLKLAEFDAMISDRRARLDDLQSTVQVAPELERRFTELTRDYQQYRALYEEVLMQTERERIGRVGEEQDVVTFNVIDPPAAPLDPVSPSRTVLLVGVLFLSAGAGVALAFLLSQLNRSFMEASQLVQFATLPVLGAVSLRLKRRRSLLRSVGSFSVAAIGLGVMCAGVVLGERDYGPLVRDLLSQLGS